MRQVGHAPLSNVAQLGPIGNPSAPAASTPSRWQSIKHSVSEGLHSIGKFFSGLKNAVASLFERRPSVPSGPQSQPISLKQAQQRIDNTLTVLRGKLAAQPHAAVPKEKTVFKSSTDQSLNTFLRATGKDTMGKAVSDLVKPLMADTADAFWAKAQTLLVLYGENGKPAELQLDPARDPKASEPGEIDRRVGILATINDELLKELFGDPDAPDYKGMGSNFPLPVKAAISQISQLALEHCDWDTNAPDSAKSPDQLLVEKNLKQVVVAHVILTALNPTLSDLRAKIGESQPAIATGLTLIGKMLQNEFNGILPGKKEPSLVPLTDTIKTKLPAVYEFTKAVNAVGASWGGLSTDTDLMVGTIRP